MIEIGDKVVCIHGNKMDTINNELIYSNIKVIEKNIYTVELIDETFYSCRIKLYGIRDFYYSDRFVSLKYYRKQKLKQICSNREIKL